MAFISLGYTMEPPALQRACCARRRPGNGREGARGTGEGFWGVREDARAFVHGRAAASVHKGPKPGPAADGAGPHPRGRPARGATCPSTRSRIRCRLPDAGANASSLSMRSRIRRSVGQAVPVRRRSGLSRKHAATRRREGGRPIFIQPAGMAGKNCPISVQPAGEAGAPGQRVFYNILIKKNKIILARPLLYPEQQRHRPGQAHRPATATGTAPTRYTVPYRLLPYREVRHATEPFFHRPPRRRSRMAFLLLRPATGRGAADSLTDLPFPQTFFLRPACPPAGGTESGYTDLPPSSS